MADHALPEADVAREWLATMMLIRRFEERAGEMYAKAKVGGFLHLAIGEEATIVGSVRAMRATDYLISTYRSHGHALARGTEPERVMAELFGKEGGLCRGRGGSMHMFDLERRFMGGYGIVGGNLPIAAGFGLASDYLGTEDATLCPFGDGASNQGTFGETLNLAALWRLPVVFMVTNNRFGMGTALERHSAVTDLHKRGEGFGVPGMQCDGMDVLDTLAVTGEALRIAREERRPILVEALTYRFRGHSMADPEEYRTKGAGGGVAQARPDRHLRRPPGGRGRPRRRGPRERWTPRRSPRSTRPWRSPTPRRFPRPRRSTTTSTCSGARCAAGTAWTRPTRRTGRPWPPRPAPARSPGDDRGAGGGRGHLMAATETGTGTKVMRYRDALNEALREEMARDETVILMGEDIGVFNGAFKVTDGLLAEFGEQRVRDTPISENTIVGMGVGAAMTGLRPVVELMTINFSLLALDQIVNHAAHIHYMFGGQVRVPLVVRMPQGAGHQLGPTHSHSLGGASSCTCPGCWWPLPRPRPTPRACSRRRSATTTPWCSSSTSTSTASAARSPRASTSWTSARPRCAARAAT